MGAVNINESQDQVASLPQSLYEGIKLKLNVSQLLRGTAFTRGALL